MTVTKNDLALQMSERLAIEPEDALTVVEAILGEIADGLTEGGYWELRNFGVFKLKRRAPRAGRNIATGERLPVPSRQDIVFKPGKEMRLRVDNAPTIVRPKPRLTSGKGR